ncbi:MAG TPA: 2-oxoacid:acceptor oxidoreductase family protein [bacterium]|nr:2-oxoacid:acceptor oxidoreductase family protein [bacterium]
MLTKTIFAGFGGQGVLLMGVCTANAAMNEGKFVTYLPSYGAEVRGGTANCTVSVSTEEIASPIASSPDHVVAMNAPSLARFQNLAKAGGIFMLNSTLIEQGLSRTDLIEIRVPAGEIADSLGSLRSANMVMLGAYVAASKVVSYRILLEAVESVTGSKRKDLVELNIKAIKAGYDYVEEHYGKADKKKKSAAKAEVQVEKTATEK